MQGFSLVMPNNRNICWFVAPLSQITQTLPSFTMVSSTMSFSLAAGVVLWARKYASGCFHLDCMPHAMRTKAWVAYWSDRSCPPKSSKPTTSSVFLSYCSPRFRDILSKTRAQTQSARCYANWLLLEHVKHIVTKTRFRWSLRNHNRNIVGRQNNLEQNR